MKLLITGSDGQLGSDIRLLVSNFPDFQFIFTDVAQLDIVDKTALSNFLNKHKPDVIINCAAYTAVDKSETDRDAAFAVNTTAVENLSELSAKNSFFLVHISTDYVFDGKSCSPINENQEMQPEGYYGLSKASGEVQMRRHCRHGAIIRTGWLYSSFGHNFVKTIIKHGQTKGELRVVDDQVGTPTYAADLAGFILSSLMKIRQINGVETYHFSNSGVASWYDFAYSILDFSKIPCRLIPISTAEYPTPAPRPAYSVMSKQKIRDKFNFIPRHWQEALKECLDRMKNEE